MRVWFEQPEHWCDIQNQRRDPKKTYFDSYLDFYYSNFFIYCSRFSGLKLRSNQKFDVIIGISGLRICSNFETESILVICCKFWTKTEVWLSSESVSFQETPLSIVCSYFPTWNFNVGDSSELSFCGREHFFSHNYSPPWNAEQIFYRSLSHLRVLKITRKAHFVAHILYTRCGCVII